MQQVVLVVHPQMAALVVTGQVHILLGELLLVLVKMFLVLIIMQAAAAAEQFWALVVQLVTAVVLVDKPQLVLIMLVIQELQILVAAALGQDITQV
jgi:hypothetical protein